MQAILGIPVVLMGFGLPDDRIHGPNEKFHLPNFFKGIETSIQFLAEVGAWQAQDLDHPHSVRAQTRRINGV